MGANYLVRRSKIIFWNVGYTCSECGRSEASGKGYKSSAGLQVGLTDNWRKGQAEVRIG